jgi:hypothetical protein
MSKFLDDKRDEIIMAGQKCSSAPDALEMYHCSDLECPIHGERNREYRAADEATMSKFLDDKRDEIIADILRQDVYATNSGLYVRLSKSLKKLSAADLSDLRLLIVLSRGEQRELGQQVERITNTK